NPGRSSSRQERCIIAATENADSFDYSVVWVHRRLRNTWFVGTLTDYSCSQSCVELRPAIVDVACEVDRPNLDAKPWLWPASGSVGVARAIAFRECSEGTGD